MPKIPTEPQIYLLIRFSEHGKIILTHEQVFDHIFRYMPLEKARFVFNGNRLYVTFADLTDQGNPVVFGSGNKMVYFEKIFNDNYYVLGFNFDFFKARGLKQNHHIGISFKTFFYFMLFSSNS